LGISSGRNGGKGRAQCYVQGAYPNDSVSVHVWNEEGYMIYLDVFFLFRHKNSLFRHNRFSTLFFSMKEAESGEIIKVSCFIDFKDKQV
jgi:hypothetical protein